MRTIGTGPPRSGTHMLAQCLSFVKETHHECRKERDRGSVGKEARRAWRGEVPDLAIMPPHENEVGFTWTFIVPFLEDAKVIHLWRPFVPWAMSCWQNRFFDEERRKTSYEPFYTLDPWAPWELDPPDVSREDKIVWLYRQYHERLLEQEQAYVTSPDRLLWAPLLDWLEWKYTPEQILSMERHQRSRPAATRVNAYPEMLVSFEKLSEQVQDLEKELDARTPFTREDTKRLLWQL